MDGHAERNANIAAAYQRGMGMRQIASAYGLTHQRIHQILKREGIPTRTRRPTRYTRRLIAFAPTPEFDDMFRALAKEMEISIADLARQCIEHGFKAITGVSPHDMNEPE